MEIKVRFFEAKCECCNNQKVCIHGVRCLECIIKQSEWLHVSTIDRYRKSDSDETF